MKGRNIVIKTTLEYTALKAFLTLLKKTEKCPKR